MGSREWTPNPKWRDWVGGLLIETREQGIRAASQMGAGRLGDKQAAPRMEPSTEVQFTFTEDPDQSAYHPHVWSEKTEAQRYWVTLAHSLCRAGGAAIAAWIL